MKWLWKVQILPKRHVNNRFLPQDASFQSVLVYHSTLTPVNGVPFFQRTSSQPPSEAMPCFALPHLARRRGDQLTQGWLLWSPFSFPGGGRKKERERERFSWKQPHFPQNSRGRLRKTAQSRTRPSGVDGSEPHKATCLAVEDVGPLCFIRKQNISFPVH